MKEPLIDASRGEALERDSQTILVVGSDRAHAHRSFVWSPKTDQVRGSTKHDVTQARPSGAFEPEQAIQQPQLTEEKPACPTAKSTI